MHASAHFLNGPTISESPVAMISVFVFRIENEWFALPIKCIKEVLEERPIHPIPHSASKVVQGLINVSGKLEVFLSLLSLFHPEVFGNGVLSCSQRSANRLLSITSEEGVWVFSVDEIAGVFHVKQTEISIIATSMTILSANFLKGNLMIGEKRVGLLDESLLISAFMRSLK